MGFEIIILAAGEGRRFGSPKQLALYQGKTLLEHAIDTSIKLGKNPIVTLGAHREEIQAHPALQTHLDDKTKVVCVEDWNKGMSRSISAGVKAAIKKEADGVLVLLVDQPLITSGDLKRFTQSIVQGQEQIIASEYQNSLGVPAYFSHHYFLDLLQLEGDVGARKVIMDNSALVVKLDNRIHDVDTPEQLQELIDSDEL